MNYSILYFEKQSQRWKRMQKHNNFICELVKYLCFYHGHIENFLKYFNGLNVWVSIYIWIFLKILSKEKNKNKSLWVKY